MKLKFDWVEPDLINYLLSQKEMVKDANLYEDGVDSVVDVKLNAGYTPYNALKTITLYNDKEYNFLLEFDKEISDEFKTLTYKVEDGCCEYCYSGFVRDLFNNDNIYSVKSNFLFNGPCKVEITVTYNKDYKEEDLLKYIKEHE